MRVPVGKRAYLTDDDDPQDSIFHRRIQRVQDHPVFPSLKIFVLDCGHAYMVFSSHESPLPVKAFCSQCKDSAN